MFLNGPSGSSREVGREVERAMRRSGPQPQRQGPTAGAVMWRWFSGAPLDGQPHTDAGWFRYGTQDLTPAHKRAHGWDYMPRVKRAGFRGGATLGSGATGVGWWLDPVTTIAVLVVVFVVTGVWFTWRMKTAWAAYKLRKEIARPLAIALSRVTEEPPGRILQQMKLAPNYQTDEETEVVIPLPDHHRAYTVTEVSRLVHERLGGEWNHKRSSTAPYTVTFFHKPAPPSYVPFSKVVDLIAEQGSQSKILQGLGTSGEPVWLDFDGDIAHLAANIGTGGGKTAFIQFIIAQLAYHGVADFVTIDVKMDGYEFEMDEIPGMKIYQDLQAQWDALEGVYNEMQQRYIEKKEKKRQGEKVEFPRKLVLLEEQNVFAARSIRAWKKIRSKDDPAKPPVLEEYIAELLFMARAVNINLISVFQRLTAEAAGGTEMRDQYGMKTLSRYSHNAWDSLVGTRPRPPSTDIIGRWITVMHGVQKWVQVPYGSTAELMEFVRSRPVRTRDAEVSYALSPEASPEEVDSAPYTLKSVQGEAGEGESTPRAVESGSGRLSATEALGMVEDDDAPVERYTLKEAAQSGILPVPYERAKKHRQNREDFPKGVKDGRSEKFTPEQLAEYYGEIDDE